MKTWIKTLMVLSIVTLFASGALADENKKEGKGKRGARDGDRRGQIIREFDKDGDGKLNAEERVAARKAASARRRQRSDEKKGKGARRGQGGGAGRGGQSGQGGAQGGHRPGRPGQFDRAAILKRFDKDGDGKLNAEEKKAALEAMAKRRADAIKKYDKDGDGKLSQSERKRMIEEFRKRRSGGNRPEGGRPHGGRRGGPGGPGGKRPSGK